MAPIVGIDLGTTNSCIAVADKNGKVRVLATGSGHRTIPSVVSFDDAKVHVGDAARRRTVTHPKSTIYGSKRLIGHKVSSSAVKWFESTAAFEIAAGPNGDAWLVVGEELTPPQEISAFVLSELKLIAERELGEPVTRAVVTVPAYFNDAQRQATKDAARVAGLDVLRIVNEPTAAALAYGAHRSSPSGRRYLAVVDLGGGTFDVSIMSVVNGVFEVLATSGDMVLGGDDWDSYLQHHWLRQIHQEHGVDASADHVAKGRLLEAAEQAKRQLSASQAAHVSLPHLISTPNGTLDFDTTITRSEFEQITGALVHKLEKPCRDAVESAGIPIESLNDVLLVGGMTRAPMVERKIFDLFGCKPSKGANPDEIVALGAAAHAAILEGTRDDATLLDITPLSIGIRAGDARVVQMLPRHSLLPARAIKLFTTTHDNQREFRIELYQGDSTGASKRLGVVVLEDLPARRAGAVRVEVTITIDTDSIIHVEAVEKSSGHRSTAALRPSGGLSQTDLDRLVARHRSFRGHLA